MAGFSPTRETTKIGFVQVHQVGKVDTAGKLEARVNITGVSKSGREK